MEVCLCIFVQLPDGTSATCTTLDLCILESYRQVYTWVHVYVCMCVHVTSAFQVGRGERRLIIRVTHPRDQVLLLSKASGHEMSQRFLRELLCGLLESVKYFEA